MEGGRRREGRGGKVGGEEEGRGGGGRGGGGNVTVNTLRWKAVAKECKLSTNIRGTRYRIRTLNFP